MIINGFGGSGKTIFESNAESVARDENGMHITKAFYYNGSGWPIYSEGSNWDSMFNESDNVTLGTYTYTANTALKLNAMVPISASNSYAGIILYELQRNSFPTSLYGWPGFLVLRLTRNLNSTYWSYTNSYQSSEGTNYFRFYYEIPGGISCSSGTRNSGVMTSNYWYSSVSTNTSYYICFGNSNPAGRRILSCGTSFLPYIRFAAVTNNATLNTNVTGTCNTTFTWTIKFIPAYKN